MSHPRFEIIAHRGASHDAPENTLAALRLAWRQGAPAAEIDVQLSRDHQLIVIHDPTLPRTSGHPGCVRDLTLAQLKRLDVGRWKGAAFSGEPIPTLAEVLDDLPYSKRLFVEIKCDSSSIPEFVRTVRASGKRPSQIVPIGFDRAIMREIKRRLPRLEVCWVVKLTRRRATGRWSPPTRTLIAQAKAAGLDGLDISAQGPWSARWVQQLHRAGLNVYVWTVDSLAKARQLQSWGVDGITTNRPAPMLARCQTPRH